MKLGIRNILCRDLKTNLDKSIYLIRMNELISLYRHIYAQMSFNAIRY